MRIKMAVSRIFTLPSLSCLLWRQRTRPINHILTYSRYYYLSRPQLGSVVCNLKEDHQRATTTWRKTNTEMKGSIREKEEDKPLNNKRKKRKISPKQLSLALQKRREKARGPLPPSLDETENTSSRLTERKDEMKKGELKKRERKEMGEGKEGKETRREREGEGKERGEVKKKEDIRISPKQLSLALQRKRQETKEREKKEKETKEKEAKEKEAKEKEVKEKGAKEKETKEKRAIKDKKTQKQDIPQREEDSVLLQHVTKRKKKTFHPESRQYKIDPVYKIQQDELVSLIQAQFDPQIKTDLSQFKDSYTPPSVVGVTFNQIESRLADILSAGFTEQEAAELIPAFPYSVNIDFVALHKVCRLFDEFEIKWHHFLNKESLHSLVLGSTNIDVLRSNLEHLTSLGVHYARIRSLLMECPLLLVCPLTDDTVHNLVTVNKEGFTGLGVANTLHDSLVHRPLHVTLGPETSKIIETLKKFNINPDYILRKYPNFFLIKESHLYGILKILSGHPLYLDTNAVASIVTSCPHIISTIPDEDSLHKQLVSLKDLLSHSLSVQFIGGQLVHVPSIIDPKHDIKKRVSLLEEEMKFSRDDVHKMIVSSLSVLVLEEENLRERLRLLLSLQGSSPAAVATAISESALLFRKTLNDITARYNYTKRHNEALLHVDNLHQLFGSSDEKFALLFDHSPIQYLREAAASGWIDNTVASDKISNLKQNSLLTKRKKNKSHKPQVLSRVLVKEPSPSD